MFLNPLQFNAHLYHMGQRFAWRKADACPCMSPNSGAADPYCPQCGGRGRVWSTAVEGVAGIAGAKVQRAWATFGVWEQGDVVLSLPSDSPLYAMGQFDRVLMLNSTSPFSLSILEYRLPFGGTAEIDRVFWLDSHKAIVEGTIPAVADDGTLTWPTGEEPPAGKQFTVTGRRHQEYFCYGPYPQDRAHHMGADLPRSIVLRRFDLFGRGL